MKVIHEDLSCLKLGQSKVSAFTSSWPPGISRVHVLVLLELNILKVGAFEIVDESLKGAYDEESMGKALRLLRDRFDYFVCASAPLGSTNKIDPTVYNQSTKCMKLVEEPKHDAAIAFDVGYSDEGRFPLYMLRDRVRRRCHPQVSVVFGWCAHVLGVNSIGRPIDNADSYNIFVSYLWDMLMATSPVVTYKILDHLRPKGSVKVVSYATN
uniref:Uncharacterized protein n=1 Tax=Tanacetum cinerariifolium TaxID=118510 RepID=A0A6L2M194_TANCI|nr:hypothetical protein [Tanacetum cinerariifolium]